MAWILDVQQGKPKKVASIYIATEQLGKGGFAEVYRAFDTTSNVDVALKVYYTNTTGVNWAKQEKEILDRLGKAGTEFFPSKARCVNDRFDGNRHFILVMELAEYYWDTVPNGGHRPELPHAQGGKAIVPLNHVLPAVVPKAADPICPRPEFWQAKNLVAWIEDLCEAVHLLHQNSVFHLDLKPENILLKRAPGAARAAPFIIDFNTSVQGPGVGFVGGTDRYRSPEVRSKVRTIPSAADDLWALAMVLWEVHFGLGAGIDPMAAVHSLVEYPVQGVKDIFRRALADNEADRFPSAEELKKALAVCLGPTRPVAVDGGLSSEEIRYVRENSTCLREQIEEVFAGDFDLYVPKSVRDEVATLFSFVSDQATESFDLRERLDGLGPKAIPAVFQEAYKIDDSSPHYETVVKVLADLARKDNKQRAQRSIDYYCMSSTFSVRRLCRDLCEELEVFPPIIAESIVEDHGIYFPQERIELADMCIRLSTDKEAIFYLTKYMCREYLLDSSIEMYLDLKYRIARQVGQIKFDQKALLLVQDAASHIWEELDEYKRLTEAKRKELSVGLLQLFGDAFASLGEEALALLKKPSAVPTLCNQKQLQIWRVFGWKLCKEYSPALTWILKDNHPTPDMNYVINKVAGPGGRDDLPAPIDALFDDYMRTGSPAVANRLIFSKNPGVFSRVEVELERNRDAEVRKRILWLLTRFRRENRSRVLELCFKHWATLAAINHSSLAEFVGLNRMPSREMRERALELLTKDLTIPARSEQAAYWIDKILEREHYEC